MEASLIGVVQECTSPCPVPGRRSEPKRGQRPGDGRPEDGAQHARGVPGFFSFTIPLARAPTISRTGALLRRRCGSLPCSGAPEACHRLTPATVQVDGRRESQYSLDPRCGDRNILRVRFRLSRGDGRANSDQMSHALAGANPRSRRGERHPRPRRLLADGPANQGDDLRLRVNRTVRHVEHRPRRGRMFTGQNHGACQILIVQYRPSVSTRAQREETAPCDRHGEPTMVALDARSADRRSPQGCSDWQPL